MYAPNACSGCWSLTCSNLQQFAASINSEQPRRKCWLNLIISTRNVEYTVCCCNIIRILPLDFSRICPDRASWGRSEKTLPVPCMDPHVHACCLTWCHQGGIGDSRGWVQGRSGASGEGGRSSCHRRRHHNERRYASRAGRGRPTRRASAASKMVHAAGKCSVLAVSKVFFSFLLLTAARGCTACVVHAHQD